MPGLGAVKGLPPTPLKKKKSTQGVPRGKYSFLLKKVYAGELVVEECILKKKLVGNYFEIVEI